MQTRPPNSANDWVFAYGSNMHLDDLRAWLRTRTGRDEGIVRIAPALLPGFRLVWNYRSVRRGGGAANIEMHDGATLPGLALEVDAPTLKAIDEKEGHDSYYVRAQQAVRLADGIEIAAWVYIARPDRCRSERVAPTRAYLGLIIDAAREHGLPTWHIEELARTPTVD